MAQNQLEKQKEQLAKLNKQIKEEENKIAQRLGRAIISQAHLKFEDLSKETIKKIAEKVAKELHQSDTKPASDTSSFHQG